MSVQPESATIQLTPVAVYRRTIRASLDRVWENVLDWEHLPWLHQGSFEKIELQDGGAWGWRAEAVTSQGRELLLELLVERDASRYVTRTLQGDGAGSEIWTQLRVRAAHETDIEVEFRLPGVSPGAAKAIGDAYLRLYARLWDEDEEMMREREARLASRATRRASSDIDRADGSLRLGDVESLRSKLPLRVELGGEPVWLIELDGALQAHTAVCPHLLGPLPAAGCDAESPHMVRCPWHGYRFDVHTGESCDAHSLSMKSPPRVVIENAEVRLVARSAG